MAQYTKKTDGNGSVRYKDGSKFVGQKDVPQNIKDALEANPEGTVIDELGDVVDPSTETDEGSEDENVAPATPPEDEATDEDQADDEGAGDDGEEDEAEEEPEAPAPKPRTRAKSEVGGMGFPAKDGKTLSIFSNVPHETIKNVGGIMVPLTLVELNGDASKGILPKNDAEIIEKLKKLGKV